MSDRLEERICSVWGVPPTVVGLAQKEMKYSNMAETREIALMDFLVPLFSTFEQVINTQLSEMLQEGETFKFFWEKNSEFGPIAKARQETINLFKEGLITRGEARKALGYEERPDDDVFLLNTLTSKLIEEDNTAIN